MLSPFMGRVEYKWNKIIFIKQTGAWVKGSRAKLWGLNPFEKGKSPKADKDMEVL